MKAEVKKSLRAALKKLKYFYDQNERTISTHGITPARKKNRAEMTAEMAKIRAMLK